MLFPSFLSTIIDVVLNAGAVQGFFLALILTTNKNRKRTSNKILSALLVVLSLSIIHSLVATAAFNGLHKIFEPFMLFVGPLLMFYINELTGLRKIRWGDALHFLPFVVLIAVTLLTRTSGASPHTEFLLIRSLPISRGIWTLIVLQYGYYWWNAFSVLRRHRLAIESEFSNIEGRTLSWLMMFLHVFGVLLFLLVLTLVIAYHTDYYDVIDTIVCLGVSCSIFILGYNGLFQEEVFLGAAQPSEAEQGEKNRQPRPKRAAGQTTAQNDELLQKLTAYLEEKKPYVNEALTLTELANLLGMTRNQLSFLINSAYGENFYSFVNKYRVEEVKRLIADPKNANFTILSLAFEAGFSSKSSFHAVFKKFTGITPTEYRETIQMPLREASDY